MMNPEVKAKWLRDLRSNKFNQGLGYLQTLDDKYCCLGVLCTQAKGVWIDSRYDESAIIRRFTFIPEGMETGNDFDLGALATVYSITEEQALIEMNDYYKSFAEIADWIEANL